MEDKIFKEYETKTNSSKLIIDLKKYRVMQFLRQKGYWLGEKQCNVILQLWL